MQGGRKKYKHMKCIFIVLEVSLIESKFLYGSTLPNYLPIGGYVRKGMSGYEPPGQAQFNFVNQRHGKMDLQIDDTH